MSRAANAAALANRIAANRRAMMQRGLAPMAAALGMGGRRERGQREGEGESVCGIHSERIEGRVSIASMQAGNDDRCCRRSHIAALCSVGLRSAQSGLPTGLCHFGRCCHGAGAAKCAFALEDG